MKFAAFGFLFFLSSVDLREIPDQKTKCISDAYPPPKEDEVETVVINLDLAPEERWQEISAKKKVEIFNLIQEIKNFTKFVLNGKLFHYIDKYLPVIISSLPDPYGLEIKGIASATGLPFGEIVMCNIFYELSAACTSIVAETPEGRLYHARNLDFGLFLGWDVKNNTWAVPEFLRPLLYNFDFQRNGKTQYVTIGFAGYVGAFTGVKPGVITITMNTRFTITGSVLGLVEWIIGKRDSHWNTFLARDVLDSATGFDMAKRKLSNTKTMAPCYYILGGNSSGQGVIITRDRTKSLLPLSLDPSRGNWFILQTNYDHWEKPLFIDDRRTPGKECMGKMTQKNVGFKGVFNVLSTIPVLNKLTSYTGMMQVNSGEVITFRRFCPDPCFPW